MAERRRERKPTVPSPGKMRGELDHVFAYATHLQTEYARIYDFGHTSDGATGDSRGGGIDYSNPTANVAVSSLRKEQARKGCGTAAGKIADALGKLREATMLLERAYPSGGDHYEETVMPFPKVVTRDEIKQAKEAAERRFRQGEPGSWHPKTGL